MPFFKNYGPFKKNWEARVLGELGVAVLERRLFYGLLFDQNVAKIPKDMTDEDDIEFISLGDSNVKDYRSN